jgi:sugar phosphate isomerase/epimerase/DNA-binding beta-propeller fold protein YncE
MRFSPWLRLSLGILCLLLPRVAGALPSEGLFSKTNLVAWCIVPFDSQKRGPEARAEMLERLGIHRLAYDWRAEHIPTFDAEVAAMRKHHIDITAWWFPAALNAEAKAILDCIERNQIHPQLWVTLGTEPEPDVARLEQKIQAAAEALSPICTEAQKRGCTVALYNHLGWFGEPANQVRVIEQLRKAGHSNVGSVYNFHHGHGHLTDFERHFKTLKPHLLALNLNGMVRDGDKAGKKIIPLGTGDEELRLMKIVQASGWRGPVGIIGHTEEDAEVKLRKELDGLEKLMANSASSTKSAGEPPASGREPGVQAEKDWVDNRWQRSEVGPFLASSVRLPDGSSVVRGLTVRVGPEASVLYDLAQGSVRAVWTGGFLKFDATRFGLIGTPVPEGTVLWTSDIQRPEKAAAVRFLGQHHTPSGVVLDWEVQGVLLRERPEWVATPGGPALVRHLTIGSRTTPISWWAAGHLRGRQLTTEASEQRKAFRIKLGATQAGTESVRSLRLMRNTDANAASAAAVLGGQDLQLDSTTREAGGVAQVSSVLTLQPGAAVSVDLVLWGGAATAASKFDGWAKAQKSLRLQTENIPTAPDVAEQITRGQRGLETGPFAVDTLTLPYDNPYQALLFASGVDFTADGAGYVCTIHGDVWRVTGIDAGLQSLRWKRVASGLFQPLGLKVRGDRVYVLGKDRITRLDDLNHDGVTDFYATFYDGIATSLGGHDYVTCLEVDQEGRFYYADPQGVHRVSADGKSAQTLASGFRNPNGMGASPDGRVITVAPQQGTWTPTSEIAEIRPGGWYGFGGPKVDHNPPLGRDWPLCWIPHTVDNSSGSQAWIPQGQWGDLGGQMMHLLWGRCGMMLVLRDTHGAEAQGAVVPLPVKFLSGPNRATFRAQDSSLYVAGSTGWQTSAVKDGAVQRVRRTGKPLRIPVAWKQDGATLEFTFAEKLDPAVAADAGSFGVRRWNYRYTQDYGSKEWSVVDPNKEGRDEVEVKSAALLQDGKTVRLTLADARPAMQYELRYDVGFRGQVWFSLHGR